FGVTVRFRRATVPLSDMNYIEVLAHAVSAADSANRATTRQKFFLSPFTGNPDLNPVDAGATGILSSSPASCLNEGHMNLHGGAKSGSGFTGTAWDYVFPGIPKAEMKAIAD